MGPDAEVPGLDIEVVGLLHWLCGSFVTLGARGPGNQQKHLEYIVGSG